MSQNDQANISVDGSFSTFMLGITIGVIGAMMLGTEEGRLVTKKVLNSLSQTLEKNEDLFNEAKTLVKDNLLHKDPPPFPDPSRNPYFE